MMEITKKQQTSKLFCFGPFQNKDTELLPLAPSIYCSYLGEITFVIQHLAANAETGGHSSGRVTLLSDFRF